MLVIVVAASVAGCNLYWTDGTPPTRDRSSGIPDAGYDDDGGGYLPDAADSDGGSCHGGSDGGGYEPDAGYEPDGGYLPDGGYEPDAGYSIDAK